MSHLCFNNHEHGRAIAEKAGAGFDSMADVVVSHVDRRGQLTGGVIYTEFTDASCFLHVAAFQPRWGSRDLLWVVFDYPFRQLSLERVFGLVDERNTRALAFYQHVGFREATRLPGSYAGGFARIIVEMEYTACRWLAMRPRRIKIGV
jgi:RimJ/RimL family protein N-acetyltransferase